ncbi:hypothetical protein [Nocardia cyriacigeorgica]|uniref:hypothetical protein n=1 Tax=Nocardia cyriacigeorgica TaxID=135487 RepID=UPI0024915335|nr:hypothetical protein [Nocardia cyriacigeorgica]BDU04606.1 hypothetical protein FMUBM48_08690 [Nocardia cyriacigeorgica]
MTLLQLCQTAHEMAHAHRHRFGLPVDVIVDRPVLIIGVEVAAGAMPRPLGRVVRDHLIRAGVASTPVITHLRHPRWIFLVGSDCSARPPYALLSAFGVDILRAGKRVWLPHLNTSVGWRWGSEPHLVTPNGRPAVPAYRQLLAATRAVVEL